MALKNKYARAEEIPAELKSFYVERDGVWLLDSERNEELRQTNITVMKERDALLKRFEGIDPEEVRSLRSAAQQMEEAKRKLEEEAQLKAGEFEKVLEARTKAAAAEVEKKYEPKLAELDAATGRLSAMLIDDAVIAEATKRGLRATALPDLKARARHTFKLVGGEPQAFDGEVPRLGRDGTSPMTLAEWVDALVSDAPHLFEANAGGGAAGSGPGGAAGSQRSVKNPFRKESWNLTEQMKLQKTDPALAARLKAAA
jgi:hypothetical protein